MKLLPTENSTGKVSCLSCASWDQPKTDVHLLSVLISESAELMCSMYMNMRRCQPSCLHCMLKTDAGTTHDATPELHFTICFLSCFTLTDASSNVHLLGRS